MLLKRLGANATKGSKALLLAGTATGLMGFGATTWAHPSMQDDIAGGGVTAQTTEPARKDAMAETKPLVDNGIFRRIADCPTPWPCFVIAVRDNTTFIYVFGGLASGTFKNDLFKFDASQ